MGLNDSRCGTANQSLTSNKIIWNRLDKLHQTDPNWRVNGTGACGITYFSNLPKCRMISKGVGTGVTSKENDFQVYPAPIWSILMRLSSNESFQNHSVQSGLRKISGSLDPSEVWHENIYWKSAKQILQFWVKSKLTSRSFSILVPSSNKSLHMQIYWVRLKSVCALLSKSSWKSSTSPM